jgi:acetyl esterase/lipase
MHGMRASACTLVALALLTSACAPAQESRIRDVIYAKRDGFALTMDVFKPAKPNGIGMIWVVSGGWFSNHRDINPGLAKVFNDKGITVFQVVHGSQPRFKVPEMVTDLQRAARFIRHHAREYGVDPAKLAISGASAGGHLSLSIATLAAPGKADATDPVDRESAAVQAVAAFFPPTDLSNWRKAGDQALDMAALRIFWPAFGIDASTPREKVLEDAKKISPINALTATTPRILLIHGDADLLVPLYQSEIFASKAKELGVPCELVVVKGKGHGWADMVPQITQIADWTLKAFG